jgi:NAD(P)H dehydrogenase (quinone)
VVTTSLVAADGHENQVYELGGEPFTLAELAAEISRVTSREVSYTDLTEEAYARALVGAGLPEPVAAILADSDRAAAKGALHVEGDDLRRLAGRPLTPAADVIRAALATAT